MHFLKKLEPGALAPNFELPNANENSGGQTLTLSDTMGENGLWSSSLAITARM
ncbi:MAG: hypothetical protein CM15mP6_3890 [Methanobacteriota archaeon]|nr:MAG: hypothetical protein CM15mP6_3890 [Euryarchaeota archaeon]